MKDKMKDIMKDKMKDKMKDIMSKGIKRVVGYMSFNRRELVKQIQGMTSLKIVTVKKPKYWLGTWKTIYEVVEK